MPRSLAPAQRDGLEARCGALLLAGCGSGLVHARVTVGTEGSTGVVAAAFSAWLDAASSPSSTLSSRRDAVGDWFSMPPASRDPAASWRREQRLTDLVCSWELAWSELLRSYRGMRYCLVRVGARGRGFSEEQRSIDAVVSVFPRCCVPEGLGKVAQESVPTDWSAGRLLVAPAVIVAWLEQASWPQHFCDLGPVLRAPEIGVVADTAAGLVQSGEEGLSTLPEVWGAAVAVLGGGQAR